MRDFVASRGPKLAPYFDTNRKPTCGIKMSVPGALLPIFKLLQNYSFELKNRKGSGIKRHIKFDDYRRTLFLQIKEPEDKKWTVISADEASEAMGRLNRAAYEKKKADISPRNPLGTGGGNEENSTPMDDSDENAQGGSGMGDWLPPAREDL